MCILLVYCHAICEKVGEKLRMFTKLLVREFCRRTCNKEESPIHWRPQLQHSLQHLHWPEVACVRPEELCKSSAAQSPNAARRIRQEPQHLLDRTSSEMHKPQFYDPRKRELCESFVPVFVVARLFGFTSALLAIDDRAHAV